jgi:hypothetical protein
VSGAEAQKALEGVAPKLVWSGRGEQPVTHDGEASVAKGECRVDADCGTGRVCVSCGDQDGRTCVTGCRFQGGLPDRSVLRPGRVHPLPVPGPVHGPLTREGRVERDQLETAVPLRAAVL